VTNGSGTSDTGRAPRSAVVTEVPDPSVAGVVLAAGAGSRFGGAKQVARLDGRPLLDHVLAAARGAALEPLVLVLGAHAATVRAAVDVDDLRVVECADWAEGLSASLRCGLAALPDADAVLVLLGDQPFLGAEVVRAIAAARPPARATYGGVPGHPVLLDAALIARAGELRGDAGFRDLLDGVAHVECGQEGDPRDVDTEQDMEVARE